MEEGMWKRKEEIRKKSQTTSVNIAWFLAGPGSSSSRVFLRYGLSLFHPYTWPAVH